MLLKEVPLSSKPVFDFRRLFSLLSMATAVAGSGNTAKGIVGLSATLGLSSPPPCLSVWFPRPPFFFNIAKGIVDLSATVDLLPPPLFSVYSSFSFFCSSFLLKD